MSFWREGPRAIFLRFKFLLEAAGTIKKLTDKAGRAISTQPYNPAQRAAEQQEIATAAQCAQMLGQMFPEEWRLHVDGGETIKAFIDKMRTGGLLKMRKPIRKCGRADRKSAARRRAAAPGRPRRAGRGGAPGP
jgi:hypothetical protein